jgi:Mg2+-importing ATPase
MPPITLAPEPTVNSTLDHLGLDTSPRTSGLTSDEAGRRLDEYGPNEPTPTRHLSALREIAHLFANPLVLILLVASAVAAWLGENIDASIIVTIVLLSVTVNFWQSYRSQRAADRLRASVAPTATALRDGNWQEIPLRQIVPGDVVRLSAGDLVPADARLLDSRDLSVQQSMLTGESLPADKMAHAEETSGSTGVDAPDRVFLGTSVVSGTATALVTGTGPNTLFGDIATRLRGRVPETEFEHGLRRFSLLILRTTTALVLVIVLIGIAARHDPLETLLFAVALGVGLTPEFLPMIATVTLTQGALRMARDKVIVKHLPAIQNLGSIDILCSDKTGTLTTGVMTVDRSLDPAGAISPRALALASINSRCQSGIRSPLDAAILAAAAPDNSRYAKVDEIPFDFERRRLSVVVSTPDEARTRLLVTKGAPESVLAICDAMEVGGQVTALDPGARAASAEAYRRLSAAGLRVLAVAYRRLEVRDAYSRDDESHLIMSGFVSFADHILEDVATVLEELRRDGVSVKILTGDNAALAQHVCLSIGLDHDGLVTGDDIAGLDDEALGHVAEQAAIFARVSPAEKNRILSP